MTERVVLAYSGGLDTSVAIPYLAERTSSTDNPSIDAEESAS